VIVPHDLQSQPAVEQPQQQHGAMHSVPGYTPPRIVPREDDLQRAADVLNAGERVAMLVGAGALHAGKETVAIAEALGAGVAKALLGKTAVPDDLPFVTGSVGWLGTSASNRMMAECDTLLMVGSGFPYTEFLPKPGQARGVQIDINPGSLGTRYPMEVNLVGDSADTLQALLPLLKPRADRAWRERVEQNVREWREDALQRAMEPADPVNPQRLFTALSPKLPDNAMLAADSGTSTVWYARHLQMRTGMLGSVSGTLATMGCALPYAIAAKLAMPDRVAFAFLGDGAMQMSGLTELVTLANTWRQWSDPRLIVLVLNNRDLSYVTWEQRAMAGEARFEASQQLPDVPYDQMAELLGLTGIRVDDPSQIDEAWDRALAADRPVVINAITDPAVPTVPPEPSEEIRQKVAKALAGESAASRRRVEQQLGPEGLEAGG
jgi:pyruvate dehydrogenase (quinone)